MLAPIVRLIGLLFVALAALFVMSLEHDQTLGAALFACVLLLVMLTIWFAGHQSGERRPMD